MHPYMQLHSCGVTGVNSILGAHVIKLYVVLRKWNDGKRVSQYWCLMLLITLTQSAGLPVVSRLPPSIVGSCFGVH